MSRKSLVVIIVAVLMAALGAGAWYFLKTRKAVTEEELMAEM